MKKPFLLLLSFIPLLASCNNSGTFPNPFPDDKYSKIGFKIDESNEKITRPLTTDETNVVLETIANKDDYNAKLFYMEGERQTRNYLRAFAGEFKQGYNASNVMKKDTYNIVRQDESDPAPTLPEKYGDRRRTRIHNSTSVTSQYSYGQIDESINQDEYYYFAKSNYVEALNQNTDSISFNLRTHKIENEKYVSYDDKSLIEKGEKYDDKTLKSYLYLDQSKYVFTPDSKCGANASGEIILTSATQTKHKDEDTGEEGVFVLKDGRKYQAMDNSLIVSKLTVVEKDTTKWCLVSYARVYTETVITSEVIQPNVSITKLKNPITISYSEEINHYKTTSDIKLKDELPGEKHE